jgi:hypothetical protein
MNSIHKSKKGLDGLSGPNLQKGKTEKKRSRKAGILDIKMSTGLFTRPVLSILYCVATGSWYTDPDGG